jgi:hypothetical protein
VGVGRRLPSKPVHAEWTPPASQADLDRIIEKRLAREKAKFADYDDLARRPAYWDELEARPPRPSTRSSRKP